MPGFYSTDFQPIGTASVGDVGQTYPGTPGLVEFNGYASGTIVSTTTPDTDNFIQGTAGLTGISGKNANTGSSVAYNLNGTLNINGGNVLNIWIMYGIPSALDTFAATNGSGIAVAVGTALGSFSTYRVDGADTLALGGWKNYMVDLRNASTGPNGGGSTGVTDPTNQYYGAAYRQVATFKTAPPLAVDGIRYGRSTLTATQGTSTTINNIEPLLSTAANFPQMAYYNDYNAGGTPQLSGTNIGAAVDAGYHRFGTLTEVAGGYQLKGVLSIGTTAASVYFNDANRNIFIEDAYLTYNNFNRIEIRNSASTVIMDSCSFVFVPRNSLISAANAPATPLGNFEMHDNASVQLQSCTFIDIGTIIFLSNATITGCVFRRCGTVFPKGATITSSDFFNPDTATGSILYDAVSDGVNVSACNFTNNTSNPSIRITAEGTYTFNALQFFGTATTYVEFTGTGTCTIIPAGGSNIVQAKCAATGGGTITVEPPTVNFTITNLKAGSEVRAYTGSTSDPINAVEIGGIESSTGTEFTFQHSSGGSAGYIQIFHLNYLPITYIVSVYKSENESIQVSQVTDRQYLNP